MTTRTSGGMWAYARELSRALGRRGVAVTLATLGAPLTAAQWAEVRGLPGLSVEQSTWAAEGPGVAWEDLEAAGEWLLELEARVRPDAVHLNGSCHGALPWRRRPLVVAHECALSRWEAVQGEPAVESDVHYRWAVTRGLRAAGYVVAPTAALLASLARHYGPLPPSCVISHARHHEDFPPAPVREPFILATGRLWDEARNLEVLETVAPRLDWPVLVAGELQHPDGGEVRARYVRPLGRLSRGELAGYMGRASIYVMPSRYEPFGPSALEAALAGCALVLGDIPSLREVWDDAAVFVPPDDTDMLARALRRLVSEPVLCSRMSTLARTRALEFSPERMADAYLAVYAELDRESGVASPAQPQLARAT
ncbi:glycosyltransferase family 4 protein [Vitiosangium sp. GDMCC 1.1324]|uniref:glycosyltransferase family 4 protein n=1 Tax=Vitiosangium sp. (strain GDMCC 1.1324) TaxID=2138576 RepID=UPI000D38B52A|nr:glycosyltransferase family 4 protein [Vitiosangium sp. GDMCC 1.1324]PTL84330.1 glycosyl transferase family 1 [Vitiosangium sp. GDMCC 1.1324]